MPVARRNTKWAGRWSAHLVFALAACRQADEGYAREVFEGAVPYAHVLAERRTVPWTEGWGCTFAIVALSPGASANPPARRNGASGNADWGPWSGEDWWQTPIAPLTDTTRDAVEVCKGEWPDEMASAIEVALATSGSFVWRDPVGETVTLYSAPQGIAALLRYGD